MANYEDYLPGGKNDPEANADGIDGEIEDAETKQETRQEDSTSHDWEERFKQLEIHNSQQAQVLGDYRRIIDDYITTPTPAVTQVQEESKPITSDDLWDNPDEAISNKIQAALANHPAIKEAEEIKSTFEENERNRSVATFMERHPDFDDIKANPEFASWVRENDTRVALAQAADNYDMNSADALFSLYKAEKGLSTVQQEQQEAEAIQAATLEESSNQMVDAVPLYSRSEFIEKKMRSEQGDADAERWINTHVAKYREALAAGNVRD